MNLGVSKALSGMLLLRTKRMKGNMKHQLNYNHSIYIYKYIHKHINTYKLHIYTYMNCICKYKFFSIPTWIEIRQKGQGKENLICLIISVFENYFVRGVFKTHLFSQKGRSKSFKARNFECFYSRINLSMHNVPKWSDTL